MGKLDLSRVKVGTRVKLMNGDIDVVINNNGSDFLPIYLIDNGWYWGNGERGGRRSDLDIVEIMPDKSTEMPAPEVSTNECKTLHDEIAIEAMKSLMSSEKMMGIVAQMNGEIHDNISKLAYDMAHAMLKARVGK